MEIFEYNHDEWKEAEYATTKYASLAYWLFGADKFGEAAGTEVFSQTE